MASTEQFWKQRQPSGSGLDLWLLSRLGLSPCQGPTVTLCPGDRETRSTSHLPRPSGDQETRSTSHLPRHTAQPEPAEQTGSQVVMRRPASLVSVEARGGRAKRRARSECEYPALPWPLVYFVFQTSGTVPVRRRITR